LFGKAANYNAVLKRMGIASADAICIGNEVRDGEAARAAQSNACSNGLSLASMSSA
jgi:phosphoglycolate phosphatase-like HAD superfamily hydrolase